MTQTRRRRSSVSGWQACGKSTTTTFACAGRISSALGQGRKHWWVTLSVLMKLFWSQGGPQINAEICLNVLLIDKKGRTREERRPPIFQTFAMPLHRGSTDCSTIGNQTRNVHFYYSIKINNLITGMVGRRRCSQSPGLPFQRPWVTGLLLLPDKLLLTLIPYHL